MPNLFAMYEKDLHWTSSVRQVVPPDQSLNLRDLTKHRAKRTMHEVSREQKKGFLVEGVVIVGRFSR